MPQDSPQLRGKIAACLPNFLIDSLAKESGQRVVYFGSFDDKRLPAGSTDMDGHKLWGDVVLKVSAGTNPNDLAYLQREVGILSELKSPHFPKLLFHEIFSRDPITDEHFAESLFITVEERVPSQPLSVLKQQYKAEKDVLQLLLKLASAMTALWHHPRRLVHRDLKPENILIKCDGDVVIIDLGIVRETGSPGITKSSFQFGPLSFGYGSPEQAKNDKQAISFKSDFFALGVVGYELLAGYNPFLMPGPTPPSQAEILRRVIDDHPRPLGDLGVCGERTSQVIKRMMEKQPYQRHRSPSILCAELKGALS